MPSVVPALRWGTHGGRYLAGLALVVSGAASIVSSNTYSLIFLLFGTLAFFAGWIVLPARGPRRAWVILPSYLGVSVLLTGPQSLLGLALPFLAWLLVRDRPARSYLVTILVVVVGVVLATDYQHWTQMPFALGVMVATVVGSAWLAALLDGRRLGRRQGRLPGGARQEA